MTTRRYVGWQTTSRKACRPARALSHGSFSPLISSWIAFDASRSTRSKTASKSACLPAKWWYSAPLVTRAPATIASREVPA